MHGAQIVVGGQAVLEMLEVCSASLPFGGST